MNIILNKPELEIEIRKRIEVDPELLHKIINTLSEVIIHEVKNNNVVKIAGLCTFKQYIRKPKEYRDIVTKELKMSEPRNLVKIIPGSNFKGSVQNNNENKQSLQAAVAAK